MQDRVLRRCRNRSRRMRLEFRDHGLVRSGFGGIGRDRQRSTGYSWRLPALFEAIRNRRPGRAARMRRSFAGRMLAAAAGHLLARFALNRDERCERPKQQRQLDQRGDGGPAECHA